MSSSKLWKSKLLKISHINDQCSHFELTQKEKAPRRDGTRTKCFFIGIL
ncbi:MAG: hypothetical protein Athens071426_592 [Parcubacteria group bacterium Athens0714_26]|nr:MAG: hypothetical protein Athens071426_592 [Parcubacteria group bacterium Athens0714_26]